MRFEKKCQNVNKVEMLRRKSKCSVESNSGKLVKKQSWHYFSTSFSAFCLYFQSARRKKKSLLISPLMVGPITMLECLPFLSNFCWIKKKEEFYRILSPLLVSLHVLSCAFHYTKSQRNHWAGSVSPSQLSGLPVLY